MRNISLKKLPKPSTMIAPLKAGRLVGRPSTSGTVTMIVNSAR
jgi:hypothetical protein